MMDLIDRQALLSKRGELAYCEVCPVWDAIKDAPPAPRWVRCEDELPKYTGRYIVWCGVNWNGEGMHGETMIARYHRDRKSWYVEADDSFRGPLIGEILYWMPIEPPKEE